MKLFKKSVWVYHEKTQYITGTLFCCQIFEFLNISLMPRPKNVSQPLQILQGHKNTILLHCLKSSFRQFIDARTNTIITTFDYCVNLKKVITTFSPSSLFYIMSGINKVTDITRDTAEVKAGKYNIGIIFEQGFLVTYYILFECL